MAGNDPAGRRHGNRRDDGPAPDVAAITARRTPRPGAGRLRPRAGPRRKGRSPRQDVFFYRGTKLYALRHGA